MPARCGRGASSSAWPRTSRLRLLGELLHNWVERLDLRAGRFCRPLGLFLLQGHYRNAVPHDADLLQPLLFAALVRIRDPSTRIGALVQRLCPCLHRKNSEEEKRFHWSNGNALNVSGWLTGGAGATCRGVSSAKDVTPRSPRQILTSSSSSSSARTNPGTPPAARPRPQR